MLEIVGAIITITAVQQYRFWWCCVVGTDEAAAADADAMHINSIGCDKDDDNTDNRSLLSPSSYHEMSAVDDGVEHAASVAAGTQS